MLVLSDFFPHGIHAIFSDRHSRFSLPPGQLSLTPAQERAAAAYLSFPDSVFISLRQVHGNQVCVYDRGVSVCPPRLEADACLTKSPRSWIGVRTADCLPVFLCDPQNRCVGIVHAGWRGTKRAIAQEAVARMCEVFGSKPAELTAVLGPCIRPCCYTVGPEFCYFFPEDILRQGQRIAFDLAGANIRQLLQSGVRESRLHDCRVCTCCDARFFSYRREGEGCGRNLALMVIED